jgi:acetyl esterase/lipase
MSRRLMLVCCVAALSWIAAGPDVARGAEAPAHSRQQDVVYGRKFGVALTMDVFTPTGDAKPQAAGPAAVLVVSGGWVSAHEFIDFAGPGFIHELLGRGYTVFAVVHGCQPKFTIPEIVQDMNRSVRFIRHNAKTYNIDPDRIGIYGASAGGHLSLMQGLGGDLGDASAKDPVDKESSRVQAVACFYPPTDFLNYGKEGEDALGRGVLAGFKAPFDFHELDTKTNTFVPVTDEQKLLEIGRKISPVNHVSKDDPPTLIIHGDADKLVPIQQAELVIQRLKEVGVETKLVTKPGAAHGWPDQGKDMVLIADWFDAHLKKQATP